jgi:hypothetical protein
VTNPSVDVEAQVAALVAQTGLDEAAVRTMLSALDQQSGEDVGTVRVDPSTNSIAHRVLDRGVPKWRISHPGDGMTYEMTPSKPDWQLVVMPEAES